MRTSSFSNKAASISLANTRELKAHLNLRSLTITFTTKFDKDTERNSQDDFISVNVNIHSRQSGHLSKLFAFNLAT